MFRSGWQKSPLKWQEIIAFILTFVSMKLDSTLFVFFGFAASTVLGCWAIFSHYNLEATGAFFACVGLTVVMISIFITLRQTSLETQLRQAQGTLTPAGEPSPLTPWCQVPDNVVAVYFGSNVAWSSERSFNVLTVSEKPVIIVELQKIWLFGTVASIKLLSLVDGSKQTIVHIDDNEFWVWPLARFKRPDFHTLVVFDRQDNEVFNIKYLNLRAIRIYGVFNGNGQEVRVTDNLTTFGQFNFSQNCAAYPAGVLKIN